jgi:3-hydroxyacyl-[acyl-carrier-protein] dehydratase
MENWILDILPYGEKFSFVDEIIAINSESITASYTFIESHEFYAHHFINNPITPGVILTECAAQISLACLGVFLLGKSYDFSDFKFGMTSSNVDFYIPVVKGEKVIVVADKQYFRFGKLKCNFKMFNRQEKLVCKGELAGMMK